MQAGVGEDSAVECSGKAGDVDRRGGVISAGVELPVEIGQRLKYCVEIVGGQIVEVEAKLRRRLLHFPTGLLDGADEFLNVGQRVGPR